MVAGFMFHDTKPVYLLDVSFLCINIFIVYSCIKRRISKSRQAGAMKGNGETGRISRLRAALRPSVEPGLRLGRGDAETGACVVPLSLPAVKLLAALPRLPGDPRDVPGRKPRTHLGKLNQASLPVDASAKVDALDTPDEVSVASGFPRKT